MQEERSQTPHVLLVYPAGSESRGMLEALGEVDASLERADHVFTAISRFTARPADVVVLGLAALDDRDIERAIPLFRELRPDVHILLAFPPRRRESAVKALALGADAYVLEPFYLRELVDLVRRGLERTGTAPEENDPGPEFLEKLADRLGHLIGNPLQIIELQLDQDDLDPNELREEFGRIEPIASEINEYAERSKLTWDVADLNQLLKEVVSRRGRGRERFNRELDDDIPLIRGDSPRLRAALAILATMADARGPDGHLTVSTGLEGGAHVRIVFHAPDLVLTAEEKRDFFQPFCGPICGYVGLRAATAEGIILSHGGTIDVTSRAEEAATVTVVLHVDRRASAR